MDKGGSKTGRNSWMATEQWVSRLEVSARSRRCIRCNCGTKRMDRRVWGRIWDSEFLTSAQRVTSNLHFSQFNGHCAILIFLFISAARDIVTLSSSSLLPWFLDTALLVFLLSLSPPFPFPFLATFLLSFLKLNTHPSWFLVLIRSRSPCYLFYIFILFLIPL